MSDEMPTLGGKKAQEPADSLAADDVSGGRTIPRKPRRLLLLAALAAVALVVVASGLLWARYTHSPRYSLGQMTKAAERGDWDGVQKYIDVDAVAGSFVDAALSNALGEDVEDAVGEDSGTAMGGGASDTPGSGLAGPMKEAFVRQFRDSLKRAVESGGTASTGVTSSLLLMKTTSIRNTSETEAVATVTVPADAGGTQNASVRMIRVDDHWRVVSLEGVSDLTGWIN